MDTELRALQNKKAALQGKLVHAEKALASTSNEGEQDSLYSEVQGIEAQISDIQSKIGLRELEIEELAKEKMKEIIIIF